MKPSLQSTEDLPLEALKGVFADPPWDEVVEVDESQMCFRSMDPPSWITFVASLEWWQAMLGGGLGIVATTLVTEATKDTWKHKRRAGKALQDAALTLASLAHKILTLRTLARAHTKVLIGIPMPNEYFPSILEVKGGTEEEIRLQLTKFCQHAPAIRDLIDAGNLDPTGSPVMELCSNGDLKISWMDNASLEMREALLLASSDAS